LFASYYITSVDDEDETSDARPELEPPLSNP